MTDNQTELDALRNRVEQIEQRQEQLAQGAVDAQGRSWTVSDFLSLGLTRRQAVQALGLIASGVALPAALTRSAAAAPGDDGDTVLGSSSNRWDAWMDEVDVNLLSTDSVNSSLPLKIGDAVFAASGTHSFYDIYGEGDIIADNNFVGLVEIDELRNATVSITATRAGDFVYFRDVLEVTSGSSHDISSQISVGTVNRSYQSSSAVVELAIDDSSSTYNISVRVEGNDLS
ncbi:hypothetical protein EI982_14640 [Haloplanus rallus]|uniref:Uncharacterized protein n=1 Tax=Haloplanus rallus TaxID=1816183 RepID=A0A6B9FH70_9EURY|nr:hypothetical protein [Haloplanus rallus]QGX95933.1 hypothetical protein EI982_14640 [Haloplanus rallus]